MLVYKFNQFLSCICKLPSYIKYKLLYTVYIFYQVVQQESIKLSCFYYLHTSICAIIKASHKSQPYLILTTYIV